MKQKAQKPLFLCILALICLSILVGTRKFSDFQKYTLLSARMMPSLPVGAILETMPLKSSNLHSIKRGAVVLLSPEYTGMAKERIGRIIALPGETFELNASIVLVNGNELAETYKRDTAPVPAKYGPVKLSENEFIVMGDNRNTYPPIVNIVTGYDIQLIVTRCVKNCQMAR